MVTNKKERWESAMRNWLRSTYLRYVSLPMLLCIFLSACGQSTSQGESIDSIYTTSGERSIAVNHPSQLESPMVDHQLTETENDGESGSQSPNHAGLEANSQPPIDEAAAQAVHEEPDQLETASQPSEHAAQSEAASRAADPAKNPVTEAANRAPDPAAQSEQLGDKSASPEVPAETEQQDEKAKWDGDNKLTFSELYESVGVRGIVLSEKVEALSGEEVEMNGFMAPPLTAGVRFFVLTKTLMAVCPFCSTDADWPTDIVVVYLPDGEELRPTEHPVKVTGRLETGTYTDEDTGFVSLVRIYADKVEVTR